MDPVCLCGQGRGLSVIDRIRRSISKRHVGPPRIVPSNVFRYSIFRLPHRLCFMKVDVFVFQRPPESFDYNIVHRSTLTIPTDGDAFRFKNAREEITRELAPLIRIKYLWTPPFSNSLEKHIDTKSRIQCVRHPIGQHFSAMPIKNRDQVDESTPQWNVGDVCTPNLVGTNDRQISEPVRVLFESFVLPGVGRIWLRQDRYQTHFPNQSPSPFRAYLKSLFSEFSSHTLHTEIGMVRVHAVDSLHKRKVFRGLRRAFAIQRRSAEAQEPTLPANGKGQ
jgi:hypothetical protein